MPRQSRLDAPGVLHHIMIRGIERRKIFMNDRDREDMLERLAKLLAEIQTSCYAWVFMPNHYFLFRTGISPLASVMRRLLTGYGAVSELGMSLRELARRLKLSPPAVGFSVERGRRLRMRTDTDCSTNHLTFLPASPNPTENAPDRTGDFPV